MNLLVAALPAELQAFPAALPGWRRVVTGVGKLQAALGLAEALAAGDVESVTVVGTAGALDPQLPAGVHEVGAFIQHDAADIAEIESQTAALPPVIRLGDGPMIATGDSFIDSAERSAAIRALGAQLVDMESYAYAWVARRRHVPIRVLKIASDPASEGAKLTWDQAVAGCSARLWERVQAELGATPPA
ncbi:MAG: nucleoside phosphorylase [Pseudoclavibacter sp.]